MNKDRQPRISPTDKKYFREIFQLHCKDDKLNREGLFDIFTMVGFEPNEKQIKEFDEIFAKKPLLGFNDFLGIFSLKNNS